MLQKIYPIFILLLSLHFSVIAQDYKPIADGIEYAEMMRGTTEQPIRLNLLRLDLTKVRLDVVHALDAAIGLEKTSSIATRHGAVAAINAGFFRLDRSIFAGDAVGVLQIDNELLSESHSGRCVLGISNRADKTVVFMERINVQGKVFIGKASFEAGINRSRGENDAVIYKSSFHRTTLTDSNGTEFIIKNNKVVQVVENKGSSVIPSDGFVISASGTRKGEFLKLLKVGKKVSTGFAVLSVESQSPQMFALAEDAVSGVPQLIRNGKIEITWEQEKSSKAFVETKHPRTAVAKLKDGKFLMLTVDGRQPEHSIGMNLNELAELLLELGATDAMNLDGGGSTTMFVNGEIKNKPSDKEGERSVSDAILVFPRKKQ